MSKRTRNVGIKLGSAAVAGLFLAHLSSSSAPVSSLIPAGLAPPPAGGGYTAQSWASAFLGLIPEPETACNENAVAAWENEEGGGVTNAAENDPLDTTQPEPGDWVLPGNSAGVKAYPSEQEGLDANVTAITNGRYTNVLDALSAGNDAQAVANAVASSPWGTGPFQASC